MNASESRIELPQPTGQFQIGRRTVYVRNGARPVRVDIWYPAEAGGTGGGTYLPDFVVLDRDAEMAGVIRGHFGPLYRILTTDHLRSNAWDNARLHRHGGPYPLVLFLPGLGGSPYEYSIQIEDVVSHGYVVAALEPVYDSLAVVLADKRILAFDEQLWMRHSTETSEGIKFYEWRSILWAKDVQFALSQLFSLSRDEHSPLFGAIDARRTGAFGHSLGGRAAAAACLLDSRLLACLNEDGRVDVPGMQRPYWPLEGHWMAGAFAMIDSFDSGFGPRDYSSMGTTAGEYARSRLRPTGTTLELLRGPRGGSYKFTILAEGMRHTAFSDMPWLRSQSTSERIRYRQYLLRISQTVRAFFDHTLKGRSIKGYGCEEVKDDVLVQCFSASHTAR